MLNHLQSLINRGIARQMFEIMVSLYWCFVSVYKLAISAPPPNFMNDLSGGHGHFQTQWQMSAENINLFDTVLRRTGE